MSTDIEIRKSHDRWASGKSHRTQSYLQTAHRTQAFETCCFGAAVPVWGSSDACAPGCACANDLLSVLREEVPSHAVVCHVAAFPPRPHWGSHRSQG